jgi:hypothetical protein
MFFLQYNYQIILKNSSFKGLFRLFIFFLYVNYLNVLQK